MERTGHAYNSSKSISFFRLCVIVKAITELSELNHDHSDEHLTTTNILIGV